MSPSSLMLLLLTRAAVEGFVLAVAAWLGLAFLGGGSELLRAWLMVAGGVLTVAAAGRAATDPPRRLVLAVAALGSGAAGCSVLAGGQTDILGFLGRLLFGSLFGAFVYWRGMAIAAAPYRWRAMASGALASVFSAAVAAAASGSLSRTEALVPIVIAAGVACAVGLSMARSAEESLFADLHGQARSRLAIAGAMAMGAVAIAVAVAFPNLGFWLAKAAAAAEPFVTALLILVVTPFVYVAEWLVRALLPVLRAIPVLRIPLLGAMEGSPAQDAEYARHLALQAEIFFRVLAAVVALAVVSLLVLHAVAVRRASVPRGASLEREPMAGASFGDLWRRFVAAPRRAIRPSGDDPNARVRRAYWDMLDLAERVGSRWREAFETPREHLVYLGGEWDEAEAIVSAFERARYSGRATERDAIGAERALRRLGVSLSRHA